ncbi:MAG: rRNA maturation RNase YbeY [Candidatus Makana argininalis]
MKKLILNIQTSCNKKGWIPSKNIFLNWINSDFIIIKKLSKITIRIVDTEESRMLNFNFRGKNIPTNVISFPFEPPKGFKTLFIGDLVICKQLLYLESKKQKKNLKSYWAHIFIHGLLHLLGYNHLIYKKAINMENLESNIMQNIGYNDPYLDNY